MLGGTEEEWTGVWKNWHGEGDNCTGLEDSDCLGHVGWGAARIRSLPRSCPTSTLLEEDPVNSARWAGPAEAGVSHQLQVLQSPSSTLCGTHGVKALRTVKDALTVKSASGLQLRNKGPPLCVTEVFPPLQTERQSRVDNSKPWTRKDQEGRVWVR